MNKDNGIKRRQQWVPSWLPRDLFMFGLAFFVIVSSSAGYAVIVVSDTPAAKPTDDPFVDFQWGLFPNGQISFQDLDDINLVEVPLHRQQDVGAQSLAVDIGWVPSDHRMKRKVRIAVVDSGVDTEHEDLVRVLGKGKTFFDKPKMGRDSERYYDSTGHGTTVFSLIGADINNGTGISGLTNNVEILPYQVSDPLFTYFEELKENSVIPFSQRVTSAILYAVEQEVDLIHLSLGWSQGIHTQSLDAAIQKAVAADILIVAAAGNDGNDGQIYPCALPDVVCVGSLNLDGSRSSFSNYGGHVDIYAPGNFVLGAIPFYGFEVAGSSSLKVERSSQLFGINGYDYHSGTSFAAPFVSGTLAVMRGIWPNKSARALVAQLYGNARTAPNGDSVLHFGDAVASKKPSLQWIPSFKALETVLGPVAQASFQIFVPWGRRSTGKPSVTGEVLTGGYELENTLVSMKGISLQVKGKGSWAKSRISFRLTVNGRTYRHSVLKVQALDSQEGILLPQSQEVEIAKIFTVPNRTPDDSLDYWTSRSLGDGNQGVELQVWSILEDGSSQLGAFTRHQKVRLPGVHGADRVYNLVKVDWSGSGTPGYIFGTEKAMEPSQDGIAFRFFYLDHNLRVHHHFDFPVQVAFANIRTREDYRFIPYPYQGKNILVPVFQANGISPRQDQHPDPFRFEPIEPKSRIYYLEPVMTERGSEFVARDLTSRIREKSIQRQLGQIHRFDLRWVGLLPQDPKDGFQGVELVFFAGSGTKGTNWKWTLGNNYFGKDSALPLTELHPGNAYDLGTEPFFEAWGVGRGTLKTLPEHRTIYSRSLGRTLLFDGEGLLKTRIEISRDGDRLLGVFKTFVDRQTGESLSIVETNRLVKVLGQWGGKDVDASEVFYRSTYHEGSLFARRASPVVIGKRQRPGLVIDHSRIFAPTLLIHQLTDSGEFYASLDNSFSLPRDCVVRKAHLTSEGFHEIPVTCKADDGIRLQVIVPKN